MATRRSSFRFRLPWSQDEPASPAAPATQPSTRPNASTAPSPATRPAAPATSTTNLSTAETPTSNQPTDSMKNTTPGIPTSPTQAGTKKNNQLPNTSLTPPRPIEPSTTSTSLTPATPTTAETQTPLQPSNMNSTSTNSPARSTSQTTTSNPSTPKRPPFRPAGAAPSPKNRASRSESQPTSPPQSTNKSRISSPPASPSDSATKSHVSQSPSSSRPAPQSPAITPTSSPTRKVPQVLSTKTSQESSKPSVVKTQMQEKNQAASLPTSPPKSLQEIPGPSSKSKQVRSPMLDKKEPAEQMELQTKKATMLDEAKASFIDKAMQPSEVSVLKSGTIEGPSEKSHSSSVTGESKMLKESASNIQETKEVVHETRGKAYGAGADIVKLEEATEDHILVCNGRETRGSASQTRNKTIATGSSQKAAASRNWENTGECDHSRR
ncbi:uncharacterized protein PB18E9.04c-like [Lycium barbarum]|uniref:uncharacterized protein PB18E9.04c-like n=1 Tax=Lycium barbarum TaxID=112863 RepID=UPI00293E92F2|nr:uncharacterized protein PB18E9.04c-like [Lycium barbarum]